MTQSHERGSSTTAVVLLVPVFLVLLAFAVFAGRVATTRQDVVSASRDAARAAAARQAPGAANADGVAAAHATLAARGVSCGTRSIAVDVSSLEPGGHVIATVTCVVSGSDLLGFWFPASKTVTATSTAVVDTYRGG